jgi:hypothetical protein
MKQKRAVFRGKSGEYGLPLFTFCACNEPVTMIEGNFSCLCNRQEKATDHARKSQGHLRQTKLPAHSLQRLNNNFFIFAK